jgi:hypothetical protein
MSRIAVVQSRPYFPDGPYAISVFQKQTVFRKKTGYERDRALPSGNCLHLLFTFRFRSKPTNCPQIVRTKQILSARPQPSASRASLKPERPPVRTSGPTPGLASATAKADLSEWPPNRHPKAQNRVWFSASAGGTTRIRAWVRRELLFRQ